MKAYSIDFRQKIIDTYHAEPISQKAIAKRFSVALSFVQKLLKQYRKTKNITPKTDQYGVKCSPQCGATTHLRRINRKKL